MKFDRKKAGMLLFVAALWAMALPACKEKPKAITKQQVMAERLDDKLNNWQSDAIKVCLKKIEDRAVAIVDSTIIADARHNRDTLGLPHIPGRPLRPDFVPPKDSTPVKPILDSLK